MRLEFKAPTKQDNYARLFFPESAGSLGSILGRIEADGLSKNIRNDILQIGLKAAADVVERDAKKNVRVRTGQLKRSIRSTRPQRRVRGDYYKARDYAQVKVSGRNWFVVEFGRQAGTTVWGDRYGSSPGYPYLRPAINDTHKEQFEECVKALRRAYAFQLRDRRDRSRRFSPVLSQTFR